MGVGVFGVFIGDVIISDFGFFFVVVVLVGNLFIVVVWEVILWDFNIIGNI